MTIRSLPPNRPRAERMGPLATLPVFYKLEGRKVLVAGGSEAAAWKAELLAAAGAEVHVDAETLDPVFSGLIATPGAAGSYVWRQRTWSGESFSGMQMAICDADTEAEARAFYDAARAVGVAVNVIDKPEFCEFQFGAIVNRSPAVIAISTDGAAPILGQAIRRRIETLIAPQVAQWAHLAGSIRMMVNERLSPGAERRAFWEAFVDRAFGAAPAGDMIADLLAKAGAIKAAPGATHGRVTLVGAGPGDAEFLTLKAVRALQAADVILYDDLVSDEVLELARREARRMLVGKRGGRESCRQDDINATMVRLARAGKHVVRLKGGDPMIFGRAGEEIARLEAEGIAVSVVPGITSALAMAAQFGVSLTHRDHAQSVRFVTGHGRNGKLPSDLDWSGIADPKTTTIFYMGGRTADQIATQLMARGMDRSTPVVISKSVARQGFERWTGPLRDLAGGMALIGCDEPVLVGIGSVFASVAQGEIGVASGRVSGVPG
ncbi:MAG: siroheme synthase CysG [Hoeflea sp.]|uniref:siroheme synthase CysG n=1 Tax=Hoeflea sp. TaxID=1940281 RepID=UPI001D3525A8|nr:siroheme synthase CysG [Hoeflea sp.]MBU4531581.1 siroheme synthase CysG [Alphaproteobacteria bacterium]MBU4544438.1 siroheme synthase CysG [Alphaproteobacteria bacterium]MBU4550325.1 siroheme synthase CysG [Alphaproteobacteria bacterium]MBV1724857.1 siroheme synthase CysG [Hoeflea sp.]MBV1760877.1 siroheme synthase CysG [Hoeflea sp.]